MSFNSTAAPVTVTFAPSIGAVGPGVLHRHRTLALVLDGGVAR